MKPDKIVQEVVTHTLFTRSVHVVAMCINILRQAPRQATPGKYNNLFEAVDLHHLMQDTANQPNHQLKHVYLRKIPERRIPFSSKAVTTTGHHVHLLLIHRTTKHLVRHRGF